MIEATGVEAIGRITPGCLGLYSDANEAALARVIGVFKNVGRMPIGIQLAHAGRKGLQAGEGAWTTVSSSAVPYDDSHPVPFPLDRSGMDRARVAFVQAARRADRIGLDPGIGRHDVRRRGEGHHLLPEAVMVWAGIRNRYLGDHRPASTSVVVAGLAFKEWLIEAEMVAAKER